MKQNQLIVINASDGLDIVNDVRFFHPLAVAFTLDASGGYDAVTINSGDRALE